METRRPTAVLLFLLALSLFGCREEDPVEINRARSYLHIASAADGAPFDITFDYYSAENVVIDDFSFRRNFPNVGYANLEATDGTDAYGNGTLYFSLSRQPFANDPPDTILGPTALVLPAEEKASLFLADSIGTMSLLKLTDNYVFTDADTFAKVRFINLAAEVEAATIESLDGTISQTSVEFFQNTGFLNMSAYNQGFEIKDADGTVVAAQNIYLYPRSAYTLFLGGSGTGTIGWYKH